MPCGLSRLTGAGTPGWAAQGPTGTALGLYKLRARCHPRVPAIWTWHTLLLHFLLPRVTCRLGIINPLPKAREPAGFIVCVHMKHSLTTWDHRSEATAGVRIANPSTHGGARPRPGAPPMPCRPLCSRRLSPGDLATCSPGSRSPTHSERCPQMGPNCSSQDGGGRVEGAQRLVPRGRQACRAALGPWEAGQRGPEGLCAASMGHPTAAPRPAHETYRSEGPGASGSEEVRSRWRQLHRQPGRRLLP